MHHLPSRYIPCDGRLTASAYFDPRSPHGERRGWFRSNTAAVHFNPRSPQGSDNRPPYYALYYIIFQPTLPAWGATLTPISCKRLKTISIHAPRIGSDCPVLVARYQVTDFNPRSPWGGATEPQFIIDSYIGIFQSTLSVGGSDPRKFIIEGTIVDFNPHSPHGERQISESELTQLETFQSTLPTWGATL